MSSSTTGQFATEQGDKLLRSVTSQIARAIRSGGADEVHDMRVAIRRFQRILVVLKPCFPRGESRRMRRGLKRVMVQAGAVRDHDVATRLLTRMAVSKSGPPELGAIVSQFQKRRDEAAETLIATLRRWMQRNLAASWRKALESEAALKGADARFCAVPVDAAAKRILPPMATEHFRCGKDAAREDASAGEIHRFRIADKNLRYTLDLFAALYGAALDGLRDELKDVQTLLGDINDCVTVRRLLHSLKASRQKEGKAILTAIKKRQHKKTEQFRQRFTAEFSSAATLRLWKDKLRSAGAASPAVTSGARTGAKTVSKTSLVKKLPVRRASAA